jgi:hypothetical protein
MTTDLETTSPHIEAPDVALSSSATESVETPELVPEVTQVETVTPPEQPATRLEVHVGGRAMLWLGLGLAVTAATVIVLAMRAERDKAGA